MLSKIKNYEFGVILLAKKNRNENAVNNMIKIVKYYLEHKHEKELKDKRPLKFRRDFKFEESTIRVSNRRKKAVKCEIKL